MIDNNNSSDDNINNNSKLSQLFPWVILEIAMSINPWIYPRYRDRLRQCWHPLVRMEHEGAVSGEATSLQRQDRHVVDIDQLASIVVHCITLSRWLPC